MALPALKARIAAREESKRLERERLEEEQRQKERREALRKELEQFEDDLRRYQMTKDEEKKSKMTKAQDCLTDKSDGDGGGREKDVLQRSVGRDLPPPPLSARPSKVTIRDTEAAHEEFEARDLSDVEIDIPGIEVPRTQFQQRTTKRALENEVEEEVKRKRRQIDLMQKYHDHFDEVKEQEIRDYLASTGDVAQESRPRSVGIDSGIDCTSLAMESTPETDQIQPPPPTFIKVYVGPDPNERQEFTVLKHEVTSHSEYFHEILSYGLSSDDDDDEQTVILPDVDPDIFTLFANFIRFGKVLSSREDDLDILDSPLHPRTHYHTDYEWARLAEAWLLGDRLRSTSFKDAVVDAVALKVGQYYTVPVDMYRLLYTCDIPRRCGIKRLLVDLASWMLSEETLFLEELEDGAERQYEFFDDVREARDVLEKTSKMGLEVEMPCLELDCEYHDHEEEGKECYRLNLPDLWVTGNNLTVIGEGYQEGESDSADGESVRFCKEEAD